jgi:RNA polymerase sigma factor (sigma-70 family)
LEAQTAKVDRDLCYQFELAHPPSRGVCERASCGQTSQITTYGVCLTCHQEMQEIHKNHTLLAHKLAQRFYFRHAMGRRLGTIEDATQVAMLAVWEAAKVFDKRKGYLPITIIHRYIWGRLQAAADGGLIRVGLHSFADRVNPVLKEKATLALRVGAIPLSVKESLTTPQDFVDGIVRDDIVHNVRRVVSKLPSRKATIVCMRYGIEPFTKTHGLEQIGARLGISKERVRQIEAKALAELTELMRETTLGE